MRIIIRNIGLNSFQSTNEIRFKIIYNVCFAAESTKDNMFINLSSL